MPPKKHELKFQKILGDSIFLFQIWIQRGQIIKIHQNKKFKFVPLCYGNNPYT